MAEDKKSLDEMLGTPPESKPAKSGKSDSKQQSVATMEGPDITTQIAEMRSILDGVVEQNRSLKDENASLRAQVNGLQNRGWPPEEEVRRQADIIRSKSGLPPYGKYAYDIVIAPKGAKDANGKQVEYKKVLHFLSRTPPEEVDNDENIVGGMTKAKVLAEFNVFVGGNLKVENTIMRYSGVEGA